MKKRCNAVLLILFLVCGLLAPAEGVSAAAKGAPASKTETYACVHDPSIVKDTKTGRYYIFGSHMAWAYSTDLQNWKSFKNNINKDYATIFKKPAEWAGMGNASYNVSGNLWAPDVIWNPAMKKWCMYMSVNGKSWNSSIVLLTADKLDGDWKYIGPVVYSGFTVPGAGHDYAKTDYVKVTGEKELASRYQTGVSWNVSYGAHAIDPCVFYDDNGTLYMTYGSWSGGIYMLQLDEKTGLRDYNRSYTYQSNVSDPYMGIKLGGGAFVSGEASYIQKIGEYYYLFITNGGLQANGGYNMRIFRSKSAEGPYTDKKGHDARTLKAANNINGDVGVRLMSYYKWNYMSNGYAAEGHNSAFVDEDGKAYVVYHARTTNSGEKHQVRVHQLFVTEDGWLTAAPFDYSGETLGKVSKTAVKGTYEAIFHKSTDYRNKKCVKNYRITFKTNGKITGDKKGTWKWSAKGSPYVDVTIDKKVYKGVFVKQRMENRYAVGSVDWNTIDKSVSTMTFTVLGQNQIELWGYQIKPYFVKDKPGGIYAKQVKKGIQITWSATGNADGYYLYRKAGSGKWKKIKTIKKGTAKKYVDTKVKKNKKYRYRLQAYMTGGVKSAFSQSTKKVKYTK